MDFLLGIESFYFSHIFYHVAFEQKVDEKRGNGVTEEYFVELDELLVVAFPELLNTYGHFYSRYRTSKLTLS